MIFRNAMNMCRARFDAISHCFFNQNSIKKWHKKCFEIVIHRLLPVGRGQRCVRTKVKRVCQVGVRGGGSLLPGHSPNTLQAHLKHTSSTLQAPFKHTSSPGAHFGALGSHFCCSRIDCTQYRFFLLILSVPWAIFLDFLIFWEWFFDILQRYIWYVGQTLFAQCTSWKPC